MSDQAAGSNAIDGYGIKKTSMKLHSIAFGVPPPRPPYTTTSLPQTEMW